MTMPDQAEMLRASPWNVLVILDSCRADRFRARVPEAQTVRALGTHTDDWARAMFRGGLVPDGTVWIYSYDWPRINWLAMGADAPDVVMREKPYGDRRYRPGVVNAAVAHWVETYGQPEHLIVHYLWPHWPGRDAEVLCRDSSWERQYELGLANAAAINREYDRNLDYVLPHVLGLLSLVRGEVVITADHGDLLGEHEQDGHRLFGHYRGSELEYPELWEIPWLHVSCAPLAQPGRLPEHPRAVDVPVEDERKVILNNLRAMGYA